ncbi:MAG TPA: pyridoxal-phosphate dependent enzyme [Thermoanaerobaculia bacterium]|nr:pyridoxal-phosphate dependent enzyme [Thermoanaerobaculia bacterium]
MTPTPLERAPEPIAGGRDVYLKREDAHELGAFKWRGALPTIEAYRARGARSVVTASTGNHGAAVAWSCRRVGLSAVVYAPEGASRAKLALIVAQGAEIRLIGRDLDAAKDEGVRFARAEGLPFFEDGIEPTQYDGYAKVGEEIVGQLGRSPSAVIVPVGNGALICGIGQALQNRTPPAVLIGVAAKEAPVMALSYREKRVVGSDRMGTFADGLAVRVAIPAAVERVNRLADRLLLVSERDMAQAIRVLADAGIRAEGAAAAAIASLPQLPPFPGPVVCLVTGRNIDEALWRRAVETPESFPD